MSAGGKAKIIGFSCLSRFTGGPDPDVQHFDNGGERHRKIDVTSFDVLADSVGDEDNADQNQKGEPY